MLGDKFGAVTNELPHDLINISWVLDTGGAG